MSIPRHYLIIGAVLAFVAFLGYESGGSGSVDSPDGFDPVGSILGTVGGLFSMAATTYSSDAVNLTKRCESCSLKAYPDAGKWAIGWGHDGASQGDVITQAQADAYLAADLNTAANAVNNGVNVDVTQPQFDAMTDFTYNVGVGNFLGSTLLKKVNAGDFAGAAAEFSRWNKSKGVVLQALVSRRALEEELFNTPGASASAAPDNYVATTDPTGTGPLEDGEDA